MASPAVSTPSSAGSPASLAPAPPTLTVKTAIAQVPAAPPTGIVTTKEWTIPPRPKPGRKPATDTPPTKRKAQNRAAQRAFRERRAARVGELEDQLEEAKEEQQQRESDMRNKIIRLEAEIHRFSNELHSWKVRCDMLERVCEYEKGEKDSALRELLYVRSGALVTSTDAIPLPPRRNRPSPRAAEQHQQISISAEADIPNPLGCGSCTINGPCACIDEAIAHAANGCGKCTPGTHCQCLEDQMKEVAATLDTSIDLKRSHSPPLDDYAEKRPRHVSGLSTPLEIDFTEQFSSKPTVPPPRPPQESSVPILDQPPAESCGFCGDGTYCMCAEAAPVNEKDHRNRLAPLLNEATPPPSDTDADGAIIKLPSLQPNQMHRPVAAPAPTNSCENGPGTCQQCLSDPKSGLFCRSLAALRESATPGSAVPEGCCGGNASGGGCCKSLPDVAPSQPPPSLSCADTYKTLSTHENFEEATNELNTWVGHLHAAPPLQVGRAPIEVEAASVMRTLKFFDRRFGRG